MMLILLPGIVEDGSSPGAAWLPPNVRAPIQVTFGTSLNVIVQLYYRSGEKVKIVTGGEHPTSALMSVSQQVQPLAQPLLKKTGAPIASYGSNAYEFAFAPGDFRILQQPFQFVYDVWFTDSSGNRNPVIPTAPFSVLGTVTAP
jgi:hypothetical protein